MADASCNLFDTNWHCPGASCWRLARWSDADETVLYDERSGQTHFLAPLATDVLKILSARPRSAQWLFDELSGRVDRDQLVALKQYFADTVGRLEAAGLIEQRC